MMKPILVKEGRLTVRKSAPIAALLLFAILAGCSPTPAPTPSPVPTYTPAPTYTPNPTLTPLPTYTPWPTLTPYPTATPLPTTTPTSTPLPTRTPLPTVPPPTATPVRLLDVEFNSITYTCQRICHAYGGWNWDPGYWFYSYRHFQVNVRVVNLTKDRTITLPWGPYFIVTDGVNEWRRYDYIYWLFDPVKKTGPQPEVPPGAVVNFTFLYFVARPGLWVKEVGLEMWGATYRRALDLEDAKANANYVDCGEVLSRACPGNQLPPLPY
jgi:hypothetical protein